MNEFENITGINKIDLEPNDILVLTIDTGKLPPQRADDFIAKIKDNMKDFFPDNKIMAVSKTIDISVLHIVEEPIL